ncbi:universal stress protein [Actinomadura litoris]|uniref:Universal stress protein n=1 Tax=Actinomadura litoris TaxID=2678616 RepID=A0A7K1L5E9_9ACTN|nr:universal stress protein [Actinomadura litoris]MUN39638.1 universal stress protein [Actinomadura litoris]
MSERRTAILVGTDGSARSERAIAWAADEAARSGRELRILHVLKTRHRLFAESATYDGPSRESQKILEDGRDAASRRQPGIKVETMIVHDRSVADGLRQYADEAAMAVIGDRGLGGFADLLLGSTGLHLAGRFPGPVVVVRGPAEPTAGEVAAGLDLLEDPAPVLDHAFAAAAARGARLRVLHAWRPAVLAIEAGVDLRAATDTFRGHLAAAVAPWRERLPGVEVVEDVVIGHPVEMLASASGNAELLVVGSRGRALPLGSVSHGVIHHARCPVAVVRPHG